MESLFCGELLLSVLPYTGELGRLPYGLPGKDDMLTGLSVKRNSLAGSCQNADLVVNISDQPSGVFSSWLTPTAESSDVIRPIRSSFCIRFRPRNTPSRLIFMRHSPLGFPSSGVFCDASVVK
jgi:hypothetical protein